MAKKILTEKKTTKKVDTSETESIPIIVPSDSLGLPSPEVLKRDWDLGKLRLSKHEVEEAARHLVNFFCVLGGWKPFSLQQLSAFFFTQNIENSDSGAALFGLIGAWLDDGGMGSICSAPNPPFIIQVSQSNFAVTRAFVKELMKAGKKN